ncbi:LegC family aminotransferase [Thiolapillus brandeum]|nr:LegC family aminotransferase [Thiolapillus brandeum]
MSNDGNNLAAAIVTTIRDVVGEGDKVLHEPVFRGNEWACLKECLDSGYVSSVGEFVSRFEEALQDYTGAAHAIAVVNGTEALHMALLLAGVEPNDEVLVPALSFIATANAVTYCGAVPHFVDSEGESLGIDAEKLRDYLASIARQQNGICLNRHTGRVIRALVPMHVFGHMCDMDALLAVAEEYGLVVVEDAAEALGSFRDGSHAGTRGLFGILSFNGNKILTTGGGGAILTNNATLATKARHLTTTAKLPHPWRYRHDAVGYNCRMPNINAALGYAQLEQLPVFVENKRKLFARYHDAFSSMPDVKILQEPAGCHSNYWLQTLMLAPDQAGQQETLLEYAQDQGLKLRPAWELLNHQTPYSDMPSMPTDVAEALQQRLINLPSGADLGGDHV